MSIKSKEGIEMLKKTIMKNYKSIVEAIKEVDYKSLCDEELLSKSNRLKERASKGELTSELFIGGFALVKEAVKRTLGFEVLFNLETGLTIRSV
jgi:preprotein translocase subunit SecA